MAVKTIAELARSNNITDNDLLVIDDGSRNYSITWANLKAALAAISSFTADNTAGTITITLSTGATLTVEPHDPTKQDELEWDAEPTAGSTKPVTSGGIKTSLDRKLNSNEYVNFTGATSSTAGTAGKVPAPAAGAARYLSSEGVWQSPDNSPSSGSARLITSDAVYAAIAALKDTLDGVIAQKAFGPAAILNAPGTVDEAVPVFTLYGKSVQDGTPSPEDPADIATAGSAGSVGVVCADDAQGTGAVTTSLPTPNGLPGIPVSSGGNYTDANDQQWVCDTIDKAAGTYTRRIGSVTWDGSSDESWTAYPTWTQPTFTIGVSDSAIQTDASKPPNVLCNRLPAVPSSQRYDQYPALVSMSNSATVYHVSIRGYSADADFRAYLGTHNITMLYPLATPVVTPLTAAQIAALDALRSHEGETVIYTTDAVQPEMAAKLWMDIGSIIG